MILGFHSDLSPSFELSSNGLNLAEFTANMLTMLFPIGDDNSDRHNTPFVTYALIALNFFVFIRLQLPSAGDVFTYGYSVIPAEILHGHDLIRGIQTPYGIIPQAPGPFPIQLTILWAMFMHGGWAHLLGNMLYLWIFGDNVEDAMGHVKFLIFYLLCGVIASGSQIVASQMAGGANLYIPNLGASGAIAGVLGAYIVLFPAKGVRVLIGLWVATVPAILVIGIWILMQVNSGLGSIAKTQETGQGSGGIAYWAHIGGALAGLVLVWFFRTRGVRRRAEQHMASWR